MRTSIYIAHPPSIDQISSIKRILEENINRKIDIFDNCGSIHSGDFTNCNIMTSEEEFISALADTEELACIAHDSPTLSERLLSTLFSNSPKKIYWVAPNGTAKPFSTTVNGRNILFVFPGTIVPLNLGSHQRAFNILFNLNRLGYGVDVLIPDNSKIDKNRIALSLRTVCADVFFYKNRRKKFKRISLAQRWFEKRVRTIFGKNDQLPDLFSERTYYKPTESAKRWVNTLFLANKYRHIIVSYAWMMNVTEHILHLKDEFRLICDTHDVQYNRNSSLLNRRERIFFGERKEKRLELKSLKLADTLLAISESDARLLRAELGKKKIVTASSGFDYQLTKPRKRPMGRPIHFGFIGGTMEANVRSLRYIIDKWWPVIRTHSPESLLYIAGSVSRDIGIQSRLLLDESLVSLGFVKQLDDFYNKIEVSLNPVFVQGGLNFKSVEAVFAGKHLITNELGRMCLGEKFECLVTENEEEIVSFMNAIEFDPEYDYQKRCSSQKAALRLYSNKTASKSFLEALLDQ